MDQPVYLGDEFTAAGFHLAGVLALSPELSRTAEVLDELLAQKPPLVLLGASHAAKLPAARLSALLRRCDPPVLILGDRVGSGASPNPARAARARLGIESS